MRVCLIGNYYPGRPLDEGMAKVGACLAQELAKRHDVLHLTVKNVFSGEFWKALKDFHPEIVHYIPGTSVKNLLLIKIVHMYCRGAKTITSVQQPNLPAFNRILVPLLKPDTVLVQSLATEDMFNSLHCQNEFLPNGVDSRKYRPFNKRDKRKLRTKYGISAEKPVVTHIGSLRKWRNVDVLVKIQRQGSWQVIAVASTTNPSEAEACRRLRQAGCIVWQDYFDNLEEVYALSDCYVFPTTYKLGSIETPLTVMEAMSCNLPVITTRYGALPRLFDEGDGLYFTERDEDFMPILERISADAKYINTREKASAYAWGDITDRLETIYSRVLNE